MSYYKRKRRGQGQKLPEGSASPRPVQVIRGEDFNLQKEDAGTFSIRWEATFAIEKGCFLVSSQPGRLTAYPGYPVADLQRAIQRARRAPGLPGS